MKVHILGICGTFMGGVALLAKELGFEVEGSDANVYPPMSTQLEESGVALTEGYAPAALKPAPDLVVIGNALSRGNPAIEHILDNNLPYVSGPQWLADNLLRDRWVLGVSGTHGKTTTTSMLAWILECAGLSPGFLIGGMAENFGVSSRMGTEPFFVVEADEYDSAFFDKRSKFVHYCPRTLVINNIEFDHADIFPDLEAIKRQFHHLVRTVPGQGLIVRNADDAVIDEVMAMGCWTPQEGFGDGENTLWNVRPTVSDYSEFEVLLADEPVATLRWALIGRYNADNALAAIAAARHAGVPPGQACEALQRFKSVARRLEKVADINGTTVYDDFAHHPTAIAVTLEALRQRVGNERIIAIFEPCSNTMRLGCHQDRLAAVFEKADRSVFYRPSDLEWDLGQATEALGENAIVFQDIGEIIDYIINHHRPGDHILIMSNGSFGGLRRRLVERLRK